MTNSERDTIFGYIFSVCEILKKESQELLELIDYTYDAENISRKVSAYEEEADSVFHDIAFLYQNSNLICDPEAATLLELARGVEDCTDIIDELCTDFVRYNVTTIRDDIFALMVNITRASNKLTELMFSVKNMDKLNPPIKHIVELDNFKVEATKMLNDNLRVIFSSEENPIEVIRWKAIFDSIRSTYEAFEHVADTSAKSIFFSN